MNIFEHPNFKLEMKYVEFVSNFYIYNSDFDLYNLGIKSLYGCPIEVFGGFNCSRNVLIDLKYCPKIVRSHFNCSFNRLTSLNGSPNVVAGVFNCSNNFLSSLYGCPEIIHGDFNCSDNHLMSLNFFPKIVRGDVIFYNNNTNFLEKHIRSVCDVKGNVILKT